MAVMSVCGALDSSDLGVVSPHEHLYIDMRVFFRSAQECGIKRIEENPVSIEHLGLLKRNPFLLKDNVIMLDSKTQTEELMYFRYAGGKTVVDATTIGLGRDIEMLKKMAIDTGLHIIAGAGFYVEPSQTEEIKKMSIDEIKTHIIKELTQGIGHTSIKAGVIGEVGISQTMMPFEEKSLRGSCLAHKETNAPLLIHINPWSIAGLDALKIIKEEKVDPSRVVICHVDVENREDYIFSLLDSGVYIEFDNFGKEMYMDKWDIKEGSGRFVTDIQRVKLITKLIDRGYEKQVLLSCDICLKTLLHAYGGWGYDHVLTHIVPMLQEQGVREDSIKCMLETNPKNWLNS